MICQAYSHNKKGVRHAAVLLDTLRQNAWVALCGAALLCGYVLMNLVGRQPALGDNVLGTQFCLLSAFETNAYLYGVLSALVCTLLAARCLRFALNKSMVNVYGSIGVRRMSQFLQCLVAGVLLLLLVQGIPFAVMLGYNLKQYGFSAPLLQAWGFLLGECLVQSLFLLSAAAMVTAVVGTMTESLLFSVGLVHLPLIGAFILFSFAKVFLWGNSTGVPMYGLLELIGAKELFVTDAVKQFSPTLFAGSDFAVSGAGQLDAVSGNWLGGDNAPWRLPGVSVLVWWGLGAVLLAFLGAILYQRRKMEIAGFIGKNKVLNGLFVFFSGACVCAAACSLLTPFLHWWGALLLGLLLMALTCTAVIFFLLRNKALVRRSLKWLPLPVGGAVLLAAIMLCGGLGYTSRVPELAQIKNVSVTFPSRTQYLKYSGETRTRFSEEDCFYPFSDVSSLLLELHTERDVRLVQSLHRELIGLQTARLNIPDNDLLAFDVIYTLNDGSTVWRHYENVPAEFWEKTLALSESDRAREAVSKAFAPEAPSFEEKEGVAREHWREELLEAVTQNHVAVLSADRTGERELTLSTEEFRELKRRLSKDLSARTARQIYFPEQRAMGYLDMGKVNVQGNQDPVLALIQFTKMRIPLTPDMTETLAFLQENGMSEALSSPLTVTGVWVMNAETYRDFGGTSGKLPVFEGITLSQKTSFQTENMQRMKEKMKKITDPSRLSALWKASRDQYYDDGKGSYLLFELSDGDTAVTAYLPGEASSSLLAS